MWGLPNKQYTSMYMYIYSVATFIRRNPMSVRTVCVKIVSAFFSGFNTLTNVFEVHSTPMRNAVNSTRLSLSILQGHYRTTNVVLQIIVIRTRLTCLRLNSPKTGPLWASHIVRACTLLLSDLSFFFYSKAKNKFHANQHRAAESPLVEDELRSSAEFSCSATAINELLVHRL